MGAATPWVVMALTAASGAYAAYAQRTAARAEEAAANQNAKVAENAAADALQRGAAEEGRHRDRVRRLIGTQRAGIGASGIELESGSPLELVSDTAALGELDALTIRSNAAREAYGYRAQGNDMRNQGRIARARGANAVRSTLLSTAVSSWGNYSAAKNW